MLYGLSITGDTPQQRRASLDAAIEVMRRDLITATDAATARFFDQSKMVLYVKPGIDDPQTAEKMERR